MSFIWGLWSMKGKLHDFGVESPGSLYILSRESLYNPSFVTAAGWGVAEVKSWTSGFQSHLHTGDTRQGVYIAAIRDVSLFLGSLQ